MKYTVTVNEAKKEIKVTLDGYEGIARCCPTDNFNLGTGIELALERAKVAKAEAEKPKVEAKPDMSVATAIKVLEKYVGGHIAIIGGGENMSEEQKAELRMYADKLAPEDMCSSYEDGYADGYEEGVRDALANLEDECDCEDCDEDCECDCHSDKEAEILGKAIADLLTKVMSMID
jgi:hypothetical protein